MDWTSIYADYMDEEKVKQTLSNVLNSTKNYSEIRVKLRKIKGKLFATFYVIVDENDDPPLYEPYP